MSNELNAKAGQILDAAWNAIQEKAREAGVQSKEVMNEAAADVEAIGRDLIDGKLSIESAADMTRKVGVTVESKLARIARQQARDYVKTVLKLITGGAADLLGALGVKLPV